MTIEHIENSLPNGLHDAKIQELAMDYRHARLVLSVEVLVGLPSQPSPDRERYRCGQILFRGVQYCSVEYPQPSSVFQAPGSVSFSYERTPAEVIPEALKDVLPAGTQCYSLFVRDWLSHIHVAAGDVGFFWLGDLEASER